jgi:hypothetical protein
MASFVPIERHPQLRWRMDRAAASTGTAAILARERPEFVEDIYRRLEAAGPVSAGEMSEGERRSQPWWGWTETKLALEYLFWAGRISARRRPSFERVYDITERVIPAEILALPTPSPDDAKRALLELAGRHVGIGTARDLADYYRLLIPQSRPLIADLVAEGALIPVKVESWSEPAYLHRDARIPRRIEAATLLSPFDSVVWERSRNERLFDFHYRIEIYTPAPKRVFGYYVLPFLLGDRIVARVDLKSDRQAGALLAHGAFAEAGVKADAVVGPLARELHAMAAWLGLDRVVVGSKGDLSRPLARAAATAPR